MKLYKIFTFWFYITIALFNYGYSFDFRDYERIFTSAPSGKYHVIVGSYKKQSNAKKALLKFNKLGYKSAKILYYEKEKNFRISILSFETQRSAINFSLKLNQLGIEDSWIFYNSEQTSLIHPIKSASNSIKPPQSKPKINLNLTSKNVSPVLEIKDEKDSKYHILVGSFKIEEYANNFKKSLQKQGYLSAKVFSNEANGDYNVIINSLDSKIDAERFIKKLADTPYRNASILGDSSTVNSSLIQTINSKVNTIKPSKSKPKINPNLTSKNVSPVLEIKDEKDSKYHILVGSFKIEEYANNFKKSLQKQGYLSAKVFSNEANGDYNVIINSLDSKIDAERFIKKLADTPYRNASILVDSLNGNSSLTQLINSNKSNPLVQNEEKQNKIKEEIESVKMNDVTIEKPNVQPKREPIILTNPVSSNSINYDEVSQANVEEKMADQIVNNNSSESSKNDLDMQKANLDQEMKKIEEELDDIPSPQKRRKIEKKSEKNIFLAKKDYDKFSYDKAQQKYLEIVSTGKESKEAYEYLANSYFRNSQYEKAVIWYNKLISNYPNDLKAEIYYRASLCFKSQGAYEISNTLLEKYLDMTNNLVIKDYYEKNPNYLEKIKLESKKFGIELTQISTENSDFGPSFYGENQLIYSSTLDATGSNDFEWSGEPFLDLFVADIDSLGNLNNPKRLSNELNTEYHESSATVTRDKKKMFFTRNNFINGKLGTDRNKQVNLKIYSAESEDGENWGGIKELPFNDDNYSTAHPTLSIDEKKLYFSSDMPGTFGYSDIWYVDIFEDGEFGEPINLGPQVNTEFRESFPFIGDNNILYFSSDGRIGLGGFDIYYTDLDKKGFPVHSTNIGEPVNSKLDDFGFIYKESKDLGYFSSNRKGLWGSKSDEVYKVSKRGCNVNITGIVFDKNTKKPIANAHVKLIDENGQIIAEQFVGIDAVYRFDENIKCSVKYSIEASKLPGYVQNKVEVQLPDSSGEVKKDLILDWASDCIPDDLICLLNINPILFDLDKYYINPRAAKELRKVYAAMVRYPNLNIFIASHTDSRGSNEYNNRLSINRAISTKNWLVRRGIEADRLTTDGFGEFELENYCEDNVTCQEEEHQLNRRSVFKIK